MLNRFAYAALAALALVAGAAPRSAGAQNPTQKALVYCPVGIDVTGCDRIVAALGNRFGTIDRGYDGSKGTVDIGKVDLHHYSVFIVPSLADDDASQPYARLIAAAPKLKMALNGRVAVYSGSPDQGGSNRSEKDGLITRLATWAADGHTRKSGLVGLVAFLDLSKNVASRYSWISQISYADVSADEELQSFASIQPMTGHASDVLAVNGKAAEYGNMASYGLHIGAKASPRTMIGAVAGTASKQTVLVMYTNADGPGPKSNSSASSSNKMGLSFSMSSAAGNGPTLTTDKPDYQPGDRVTFTGTGWQPGDTVTITVHEDPTWTFQDRQVRAAVDGSGNFTNRDLVVDVRDIGVTYTATAVADPSGLVAQTTFTDGAAIKLYNDAAHTDEDYQFSVGQTVYIEGTGLSTSKSYKFEVKNAAGTTVYLSSTCKTGVTSYSETYAPLTVSTTTDFTFTLHEYTGTTCSDASPAGFSKTANVAQATVYADSAMTTPLTIFSAPVTLSGTVAKVTNATTLAGTGTSFTTQLSVGSVIAVPNTGGREVRRVIAIASNTSLTVNEKWTTTASGQTALKVEPAYVAVAGLRQSINDWDVYWINPSGTVSCANTGGGDRPDSGADGKLPKTAPANLEYIPSDENSTNWNDEKH
jgi:hypothetical protein